MAALTVMRYDFDTPVNRRRDDAVKWAVPEGALPMWIADMDFPAAPEILDALQSRLDHGVFGYGDIPAAWYDAYIGWWRTRHGFTMERDWLIFCTGVVPAISSIVRKLTTPNENVLLLTPVYNIFFNSTLNNGCRALECPLLYEKGAYAIDWEDFERKLSDPQTTLFILCNPHNPVGKIWDAETLARIGALCRKHHVTVISDEIHCDLTAPGKGYVPFLSVSDDCRAVGIACIAPTKAFNLAGMQTAAVAVPDPVLRHKVWRGLNTDEVAEPNAFAVPAAVAAFTKGAPWLDALREYIFDNRTLVCETLEKSLPAVHVVPGEATYLLWLDVSELAPDSRALCRHLEASTGLYLAAGEVYGKAGQGFLRMNVACPRAMVLDGLQRLIEGVRTYQA